MRPVTGERASPERRTLARPRALRCASLGASPMLDIAMLAMGLAFFALSIGYVLACDGL
jgi:hypothetical protein